MSKKKPTPTKRSVKATVKKNASPPPSPIELVKLDMGCGPNKPAGFIGVDQYAFPGVDVVCSFGKDQWPFKDGSASEIQAVHSFEHLTAVERMHFMNEACRVLVPGGQLRIACPQWKSSTAYGDMTHQWPPVSSFFANYTVRQWRLSQAPHTDKRWNPQGMDCDFDMVGGNSGINDAFALKADDARNFAINHYVDSATDIFFVFTKPLEERQYPELAAPAPTVG